MSSTLLRYHTKTLSFLPVRRRRRWRAAGRRFRRRLSRRACKRILRSVLHRMIPFRT